MITKVNIFQIFPRFILQDTDGFALCKALETGLNYFLDRCNEGLALIQDIDQMPEWRLDEMAWELNCLYDYKADAEIKREWIRNAAKSYKIHGTAEGIRQYLKIYFGESSVDEYFEFGGEPGQFNVSVTGLRSDENEKWIRAAVEKAKNVRSELLNIIFNGGTADIRQKVGANVSGIEVRTDVVMY